MAKDTKYLDPAIWERRLTRAESDQEQMFSKHSEWWKFQYAERDDKNTAPWRSKIHLPLVSNKLWNIVAKFIQQEPGFEVRVRNDDNEELSTEQIEKIADKVQRKLEFDYHNPELPESIRDKLTTVLVSAAVTGTGLAKVPWVIKNKVDKKWLYENGQQVVDKKSGAPLEQTTTTKMGYNDLEPVNIFNVFVSPSAVSLQTAPWVIIREYKTLEQLKEVNRDAGVDVYRNLDKLKDAQINTDKFAEYKKSIQGLTSEQDVISADGTVGYLELFECYDRDKGTICTYVSAASKDGNKSWEPIREQYNPFWHGKFPLVAFYIRKRPFSFWGESLYETTERMQAGANDIFNHYMDNWNLSVDGGIMIDEMSQVAEFIVEPGFELIYKGEPPKQFKFPEPNPNQLTLVMNEIEKVIEQSTISNYAQGTPVSGLDKTQGTARGTMAILEAATDIIQFMRDNFASSIKQVGEMWLSNNRQFMDFATPIPVLKDNKFETEMLTPEELQLQMELRINDMAMQPISDLQRRENFMQYFQNALQMQTASINQSQLTGDKTQVVLFDWHSLLQSLAKHYSVKSFEKQIMSNEAGFAVQNQGLEQEELAGAEAEEGNAEEAASMMVEGADIPDEDVLNAAEVALNQINGGNTNERSRQTQPTAPTSG